MLLKITDGNGVGVKLGSEAIALRYKKEYIFVINVGQEPRVMHLYYSSALIIITGLETNESLEKWFVMMPKPLFFPISLLGKLGWLL